MRYYFAILSLCSALSACADKKSVESASPSDSAPALASSISEVPTATDAPSLLALAVPSDPKAEFYVLEKGGNGDERTIVTKRIGSSGTTYSKRLYNCEDNTVKYIGTGDSLDAMARSTADPSMGPIQQGSIAYYVGLQACE